MKYLKKECGSYNLHMIKTSKFKTIKVRVSFRRPVKKDEITMRNILANMLVQTSKKYPTKRSLAIKSQDLYAASISSNNSRIGNYINTDITLSILHDKYTEEGNYLKALDFLHDIIYDPNVIDNRFQEEALEIVKVVAKTSLDSLKEDSSYYSLVRLFEVMNPDSPLSYRASGYLEDLEKINGENLYQYYQNVLKKDMMDIFVIGDIDFEETLNLIKKIFKVNTFRKCRQSFYLEEEKTGRKRFYKESDDNNQSKLAVGVRLMGLTKYERNYPLTLYSIILGSGNDSKLFREVREKHSLCYYINSVPNKLDNILVIRAGIDKNNVKKAVSLIEKEMSAISRGKISDYELDSAKEFFQTSIDSMLESQSSIMECYYMMDLLGLDDFDVRRQKMNEVTVKDIMKVAKKVKVDTVYCLEGVSE